MPNRRMAGFTPTMAFTGMGDDPGIDAIVKLAGMLGTGLGAVKNVITNPWFAVPTTGIGLGHQFGGNLVPKSKYGDYDHLTSEQAQEMRKGYRERNEPIPEDLFWVK